MCSKALTSDHALLFYHAVAYKTSSSYDHFFERLRWSLTIASTVTLEKKGNITLHQKHTLVT